MRELAQRQGFLFVQEVSRPVGYDDQTAVVPPSDGLALLRGLLNSVNSVNEQLTPLPTLDQSFSDLSLTPLQRIALWRSWHTPDVALVRARSSAAAPVLAEIVVQAARQGKRVLLTAASSAPIDATLVRLQCPSPVLPVRLLASGEPVAALPPAIRALTLDEQRQAFQAKTIQQAEQALTAAEDCCRCRQAEEPLWSELHELAVAHSALDAHLHALAQRYADVRSEVEAEANGVPGVCGTTLPSGPFALEVIEHLRKQRMITGELESRQHRLELQQADQAVELAQAKAALSELEPLAAARNAGKWWTWTWWRAVLRSDLPRQVQELTARCQTLRAGHQAGSQELAQIKRQRDELTSVFDAERQALIEAEVGRRRSAWQAQIDVIQAQLDPLRRRWDDLVARFRPGSLAPEALTSETVAAAQKRWQNHRQQDEAAGLFARQWTTFLRDAAPRFLKQLPRYASLVAGTHAALQSNPDALEGGFDLVIIEEADRLLENDLLRLARYGRRWLLVGELPSNPSRISSFGKLWQALHVRPSPQPFVFRREGDRLCCQFRPLSSRDRQCLEIECLADFPEIELRILNVPRAQPQLAQVVFPASMSLAQAKALVYRELQEAALHIKGRNFWLEEAADAWLLHFDTALPVEKADLDEGLCEHLGPDGVTCRVEFSKAKWSREGVAGWIERYLRCRDGGRTVDLTTSS